DLARRESVQRTPPLVPGAWDPPLSQRLRNSVRVWLARSARAGVAVRSICSSCYRWLDSLASRTHLIEAKKDGMVLISTARQGSILSTLSRRVRSQRL